jgi:hypothetical protein
MSIYIFNNPNAGSIYNKIPSLQRLYFFFSEWSAYSSSCWEALIQDHRLNTGRHQVSQPNSHDVIVDDVYIGRRKTF